MERKVKDNDLVLSRFLTRSRLGWAALGITAVSTMGTLIQSSTLLGTVMSAPEKLASALGSAIDIGFSEEMAGIVAALAEAEARTVSWGGELSKAEDKAHFIGESLGKLAGQTVKSTFELAVNVVPNIPEGMAELTGGAIESIFSQAGFDPGTSEAVGKFTEFIGRPVAAALIAKYGAKVFGNLALKWMGRGVTTGLIGSAGGPGGMAILAGTEALDMINDARHEKEQASLDELNMQFGDASAYGATAFSPNTPSGSTGLTPILEPKTWNITINNYNNNTPTMGQSVDSWLQANQTKGLLPGLSGGGP